MKDSIAIIGVSFYLPNIESWASLKSALSGKNTFIRDLPINRQEDVDDAFGALEMSKAGYLNAIDKFDNEYFGITNRDALKIPPVQRLFITHAVKALYNAGYAEEAIRGTNTGLFYTASKTDYFGFSDIANVSFSDFDMIGGIEGTRVAQYLDLRGPVIAIDTSCSSSLSAINAAKQSLNNEECDMAIVGGSKIVTLSKEATMGNVVHSKNDACRPFDQEADGMMNGEGAIFFVLKSYEKAKTDGDAILGTIRGVGINHGGSRTSSLTAPSPEAQKEVLLKAWKNADIDINKMRFIEAHGTGTILGDPIEVEGLKRALSSHSFPSNGSSIAISSFKGQIGHLDNLSGLAGLLRLVAALNFKKIPIQPNFTKLNAHIQLEHSGLYIPTKEEDWLSKDNERIGGVSSFGMTGTNVHLVVSKTDTDKQLPDKDVYYLQVAHKNKEGLNAMKNELAESLSQFNNFGDIIKVCSKFNKTFQVDQFNQGIIYNSKKSLLSALEKEIPTLQEPEILLLDLEGINYSSQLIETIFFENLFIKELWNKYVEIDFNEKIPQKKRSILLQYILYKYLFEKLGERLKFITTKENSIFNQLIKSEISIADLIQQEMPDQDKLNPFNEAGFKKYLTENFSSKKVIIIDFSKKDKTRFNDIPVEVDLIDGALNNKERYTLYSQVLSLGINPLKSTQNPTFFYNVDLPRFKPKRFWPKITSPPQLNGQTSKEEVQTEKSFKWEQPKVEEKIKQIWASILEIDQIEDTDDFFELGGTSLDALDMIENIEKDIEGVKIDYEDIYNFTTVLKLTDAICNQLGEKRELKEESNLENIKQVVSDLDLKQLVKRAWTSVLEIDNINEEDDFFELGGTSLDALDMIGNIEKDIQGVKIPYEKIYELETITKLITEIKSQINNKTQEEAEIIKQPQSELRETKYIELINAIKAETFVREIPENILITGATGFLGKGVLKYLLTNTNATLYCLVRKKEFTTAKERVNTIFDEQILNYKSQGRIEILEGDLSLKDLGVDNSSFKGINIDTVFHVAGYPEYVSKFSMDKHINYSGTKNIVDWSNKNKTSKLVFISTIGITGQQMPSDVVNFYETDLNLGQQSQYVHDVTKLKAEAYIIQNAKCQSMVFRIPNIGASSSDGVFPTDLKKNLMWQQLKMLINLGYYTEESLDNNSGISFFPVDILAKIICEGAFLKNTPLKTIHLTPLEGYLNREILEVCRGLGFNFTALSEEALTEKIFSSKFNNKRFGNRANKVIFRTEATNAFLSKLRLTSLLKLDKTAYLNKLVQNNINSLSKAQ